MMTIDEYIEAARALDGLSANPDDDAERAAYMAIIAPIEPPALVNAMLAMSGCGLVVRGLLRDAGVDHPRLAAPYVVGHAMSDLVAIARDAGAAHAWPHPLKAGDAVIVGPDNGAPEHVYTVLVIEPDYHEAGSWLVESIDGGQRDAKGHQMVKRRYRTISADGIDMADGNDPGAHGARRKVRWVLDVVALLDAYAAKHSES